MENFKGHEGHTLDRLVQYIKNYPMKFYVEIYYCHDCKRPAGCGFKLIPDAENMKKVGDNPELMKALAKSGMMESLQPETISAEMLAGKD